LKKKAEQKQQQETFICRTSGQQTISTTLWRATRNHNNNE